MLILFKEAVWILDLGAVVALIVWYDVVSSNFDQVYIVYNIMW